MRSTISPKQAAQALGVSEASLKRWCDKGLLTAQRTPGGHRRLAVADILLFLQATQRQPVRPEVLGLPAVRPSPSALDRAAPQAQEALLAGDDDQLRSLLFNLYLARIPIRDMGDRVFAPAFSQIGHQWEKGQLQVYRERRACEIASRAIIQLRSVLPSVSPTASKAIGCTVAGDPYQLPNLLVEASLREMGWQTQSLGTGIPFDTAGAALQEVKPRLFWLSVSTIENTAEFLSEYDKFQKIAESAAIPVVIGGRALTKPVRQKMRYAAFGDTLGHLAAFVHALK